MSLGLAFGVLVGLVPKGNLLAIGLGICLAATRVNLAIATFAIVFCTFTSGLADSLFDQVGGFVLSIPALQGLWIELSNQPFVPWTNFSNTIVMGSFVTGLALLWPVHRLSHPLFEKYSSRFAIYARRWWITKVIPGAEWADRIAAAE
jgi:uncharacterized protein (TIGR03546 family)